MSHKGTGDLFKVRMHFVLTDSITNTLDSNINYIVRSSLLLLTAETQWYRTPNQSAGTSTVLI